MQKKYVRNFIEHTFAKYIFFYRTLVRRNLAGALAIVHYGPLNRPLYWQN